MGYEEKELIQWINISRLNFFIKTKSMKHEFLERFQNIDTLIQEHKTGTPADLAQTIGVSKRTIYKYIRVMKNLGAPIAFNAMTRTYYYTIEGSFVCFLLQGKMIIQKKCSHQDQKC